MDESRQIDTGPIILKNKCVAYLKIMLKKDKKFCAHLLLDIRTS